MANDRSHNTSCEKIFTTGLPVTNGQGGEARGYGIVKRVDINDGVVIVTDTNGTPDKESSWPIGQVFAQT